MQANATRDAGRAAAIRLMVHSLAFGAIAMASVVGVVRVTAHWSAWSTLVLIGAALAGSVLIFDVTLDIVLRRARPSVR